MAERKTRQNKVNQGLLRSPEVIPATDFRAKIAQSEHPFQDLYFHEDSEEWRARVDRTARLMILTGVHSELDFIVEKFPERIIDWIENNPDVRALVSEFGSSSRWLSYALARVGHVSYESAYRASITSPVRKYLGDITVFPRDGGFYGSGNGVNVRVVEPNGADLSAIRRNFRIERDFNEFSHDAEGYLVRLKEEIEKEGDERLKKVWNEVYGFYLGVQQLQFPALKKQLVDSHGRSRRDAEGREVLFPSLHQKAAIVKAVGEGSLAVFDGTGSGKTAIGIGTAEAIGAKRVLVISPATVKESWESKIHEYYERDPGVLRIESGNSANKFIENGQNGSRYTIVNYDLLIERSEENDESELSPLGRALVDGDYDLLILDEAHFINNVNKRSDAVLELAKKINRRLILTATPVRNSAEDISRIAYLLAPGEFSSPEAMRELGPSGVPAIVDLLASKSVRRKTEDLLELPAFSPENNGEVNFVTVDFSPTQRAIYDAIYDDETIDAFSKIKLLRQVAIDHNLVTGGKFNLPFDEADAARELADAHRLWKRKSAKGVGENFDSDFLVSNGFRTLMLGAHFNYRNGINYIINKFGSEQIKQDWGGVAESAKFRQIRNLVEERTLKGEKVVIFSGHYVKGVLRERTAIDDVPAEAIVSDLYSYLSSEFSQFKIGRIDGEVTAKSARGRKSKREIERENWQNDPNSKILLTSVSTSSLGIDFTVDDGQTTGVSIVGIDLPYTYADFWQMISRVYRFGQLTPVHPFVLEGTNSIDEGIRELILIKEKIAEQLLDGLEPTEIESRILDRSKEGSTLRNFIRSPKRDLYLRMSSMSGKGAYENAQYLEQILEDGKTVGEQIAQLYSKYWEYHASGHNARLVRQVLLGLRDEAGVGINTVVDAGSGPLVLDRILRQGDSEEREIKVISVDLDGYMLDQGVADLESLGYGVNRSLLIKSSMAETGLDSSSSDAVVCSLAFQYSKIGEERAKIFAEANRVLRQGGYYIISVPENYLVVDEAKKLCNELERFGFEVDLNLSGKAEAQDYRDVPFSVWLIVAKKRENVNAVGLKVEDFRFVFEMPKISRVENNINRDKRASEGDRLVKHEEFAVSSLSADSSKGSIEELLKRRAFGVSEEQFKKYGWRIETKDTKSGTDVILRR